MNLLQLCEPLFSYLCRLNRLSRTGQITEFTFVREEINERFSLLLENAKANSALLEQFRKVELPLFFFVDSVIAEGALPFASTWNQKRLAYDRNELTGDEKFFDFLDETLNEKTPAADERLAVFYTCIGLGFCGWYQTQPEYLRKKMKQIAQRVSTYIDAEENELLTPDAYQHTNTINLPLQLSESILPLFVVFVGLLFLVSGVNYSLFRRSSAELQESLDTILANAPAKQVRGINANQGTK